MNTKDAITELLYLLKDFYVHHRCLLEFKSLLKKELSGKADSFLQVLITQLKLLSDLGSRIITVDDHEKLKYSDHDIYSIHLKRNQFNIRLLVIFDKMSNPYLLTVFFERSGKKASDYTDKTRIAYQRYVELQEEEKNG